MKKNYDNAMAYSPEWKKMSGPIGFSMCNDYLFRALMQKDERTLKALVASFLRVSPESISEIEVTNPILLGEDIKDKEFHLDIRTLLDYKNEVDLEMQVLRHPGWIERTLVYLCRSFDELNHGDNYKSARPVWQISFCNFALFEEAPEFVSDFLLINKRITNQIYTDKFRLTHVNLIGINYATEEDIKYGIIDWAKLFKAKDWKELNMLAENNPTMDYAISSIYQLTENEAIRKQMLRREENEKIYRSIIEEQEQAISEAKQYRAEAEQFKAEAKQSKADAEQFKADAEQFKADAEQFRSQYEIEKKKNESLTNAIQDLEKRLETLEKKLKENN